MATPNEVGNPTARDPRIDLLRFIGLSMIILAHVGPPPALFQLRNFDVPLMVVVSGMSFAASYMGDAGIAYVLRRCRRLILPAWTFLLGYFLVLSFFGRQPAVSTMVSSFLLIGGIGYVWILGVFVAVAAFAQLVYLLTLKKKTFAGLVLTVLVILLMHELVAAAIFNHSNGDIVVRVVERTVLLIVPYLVCFAIGVAIFRNSASYAKRVAGIFLLLFVAWALALEVGGGSFVPTQEYKYPPRIYYISYALAVAGFLWLAADKVLTCVNKGVPSRIISFAARNSIWIYLWHIPFVEFLSLSWWLLYFVAFAGSSLITRVQSVLVGSLLKIVDAPSARMWIKEALTG